MSYKILIYPFDIEIVSITRGVESGNEPIRHLTIRRTHCSYIHKSLFLSQFSILFTTIESIVIDIYLLIIVYFKYNYYNNYLTNSV